MSTKSMNRIIAYLRGAVLHEAGSGLTDGQLLECFIERREEAAVEALMRRHGPMVLGVCRRVLRNDHDAEDAFQATFLVLVRKAASVRPREMVGNWLYGVAHQTALRARCAAAKRSTKERQVTHMPEPATAHEDVWRDLLTLLDQELSRLPARYRFAIILCDLEGKTYKEAARQLGCPEGTLSARLVRGRTMLAKRLTRRGLAVSGGMLAGLLSQKAAAACLPPALLASTIKIAAMTAGRAAAAGALSPKVAALTEGVLKIMLLAKLKIATAVLLAATLTVVSAGLWMFQTQAAEPPTASSKDGPGSRNGTAPTNKNVEKSTYVVEVPSPLAGTVQFIGTEILEGEKVPPAKVITIQVDGETKRFRRLKKGDLVKEGQLLARLDDLVARAELAIKEGRVKASKADAAGAQAIAVEAEVRFRKAQQLYDKGAIPSEDYRSAKLTSDKMYYTGVSADQSVVLAEQELSRAQILVRQHDIRSPVTGVVTTILKQPGEAVKEFETVFKIVVTGENNNAQALKNLDKFTHVVKVPSLVDGIVLFVGTEIREGEKVPPERLIAVQIGGEKKQFRRLKAGDPVKEGELLARLDDRFTLQRAELAIKESKVKSAKADLQGAEAIFQEANVKFQKAQQLYDKGAIPSEDYRAAKLTADKMFFDGRAKEEGAKLAEIELRQARTLLDLHEIRSKGNGVVAAIRKHPGEAARKYETVLEIAVTEEKE